MPRPRTGHREPVPPALPPEERTVGQLVAETLRLYGRRFWVAAPLGGSVAVVDQVLFGFSRATWLVAMATGGALLLTASYVGASLLVAETRPPLRTLLTALAAGVLVFLPVPFLLLFFILPAVAWLALTGLAVPVAVIEGRGLGASLRRAVRLARADYIHALGSLATLAIAYYLTRLVLVFLLRDAGDQAERVAVFLADIVIAPVLFLGAALLYFDQAARAVRSGSPQRARRSRDDADLHPADDADRPGRADAEVEP